MKKIKILILSLGISLSSYNSFAQTSDTYRKWHAETNLRGSFFRFGSYVKERPTFFLEQSFDYRFKKPFRLGFGVGINAYPVALAVPINIQGKYIFTLHKWHGFVHQEVGRNLKLGDVFIRSNRYLGTVGISFPLKAVQITPHLGYNFLWDKYGGKNLSFFVGIGVRY